ncbi:tryptophan 7-halogenase [Parvularcula sp. ZS-1/3]|uniref:Tryptophan 7-halogenase n=2 Tax=Parvularcula mediterranea TaxID=2732508 RepID=A0A7Y3W4I0_9PROT|nr:tryptophan 7-halogenase [Parvularcula mediterranea]
MTAAALSSLLSPRAVETALVESDAIGTVGVGEATIPDIINFNALLGIDEAEFLKATNGTFKLGIEFVNWSRLGESYFHPFGTHGADMQGIDFHQFWMRTKAGDPQSRLEDYSLCSAAAMKDKFCLPQNDPRSVLSQIRYAYHFDATAYARFLRDYAEKRGVKRQEGKIESVAQNAENGFIESVTLDNGTTIEGDLFIDCSGFRGLLQEETLDVPYRDWSHWLPCDTAQAVACERSGPLLPYTRSTATEAGWRWRIPTQHRTGNGQIYSSAYMDDDAARQSLLDGLDGKPLGEPRKIKFRTGCRERFWEKNCVAIGLSGGFLEPLESTSLYLIQEGISKLISLFPTADMPAIVQQQYNSLLTKKFEQVRDFIILHYKATERDDSPFWNYCRTMDVPDSLKERWELFEQAGRVFRFEDELFSKTSWIAVFIGQNIIPRTVDPIASSVELPAIERSLASMKGAIAQAAERMPTHEAFIRRYAPSGI